MTKIDTDLDVDIDEIAIERRLDGDHSVSLTSDEVAESIRRLAEQDLGDGEIAEKIGLSTSAVQRQRSGSRTKPRPLQGDSTVHQAIERGLRSPSKRVVAAAKKAQQAIDKLRTLLAEDAEQAEAKREVRELEERLRAAKAKLSGRAPRSSSARSPRATTPGTSYGAARKWATGNGIACPPKGRPTDALIAQYEQSLGSRP